MIKKHHKPSIKLRQLEALFRRLNTNHPRRKDVEDDLFKARAGYRWRPMERIHGNWRCINQSCKYEHIDCHLSALSDYALIFGPTISNSQLRNFLQFSSVHTATRILISLNSPSDGNRRYRVYRLPFV